MDFWAYAGVVFSFIAAAGVLWQIRDRWKTREQVEMDVRVHEYAAVFTKLVVRNTGTAPARSIRFEAAGFAFKGDITRWMLKDGIEPNSSESVDLDPDIDEDAWVIVTWNHPRDHSKTMHAWFPLRSTGQVAETYLSQRGMSPLGVLGRRLQGRNFVGPDGVQTHAQPKSLRKLKRRLGRVEARAAVQSWLRRMRSKLARSMRRETVDGD